MYFWETRRMQASRLLSILMLLQARGRMSALALSTELEVSMRTIHRDIDQLSAAGVPVWADRGRSGGFQLQEGWRTRLTGLTEPESRALFLSGLAGPAAELGLGEAVASARLKVLATLPTDWQADAEHVGSRFYLDAVDWFRSAAHTEHLGAVADAVWREHPLAIRYESWNGMRDREVEPLGLVLKAGIWYMAARSRPLRGSTGVAAKGKASEPRTYRLSSIRALKALDEPFKPPKSFDLAAYWQESTRRFETGVYRESATLRVSPRGLRLLRQVSTAVLEAADKTVAKDKDGWSRVVVPIESVDHAANHLINLGADVEALAPKELRNRLRSTAKKMVAMYATK
jgi:predicted DNA-binding transcriptional regulator YafY